MDIFQISKLREQLASIKEASRVTRLVAILESICVLLVSELVQWYWYGTLVDSFGSFSDCLLLLSSSAGCGTLLISKRS